ncbi:adenine nucleotide alpha hydrolases-like protein, partial [Panus rudis PR-1116 ss-1]
SGSFSRRSLSSMLGGLSALTLGRSSEDKERGRSQKKEKEKDRARSSSYGGTQDDESDTSSIRARSVSPFQFRRRRRDSSPTIEALSQSDAESDVEPARIRPRNSAFTLSDDEEDSEEEDESDEESWSETDVLDPITSANTERNAMIPADILDTDATDVPDPLGEGVNVVIAPEPYFPTTLNTTGPHRNPRRRKSARPSDLLPVETSRPLFQRDRCTITLTQGDPVKSLKESGRRPKRYVLASDLSEESRYALEWGIGTVLRDGDEMLIVTVVENEAKVDPLIPNPTDRTSKLRNQQERQALAYILVRQATSLLQRTRLHVTIACQAWHAKNSRHMLLDIVDYFEPTMLIVGSRGLGNLKGILLGSTSHYLIQKCSVPVMVARRRLKRPPRRNAHLAPHRARVSLAQAGIDRVAPKVDQDVAVMRDQIERDDERRGEENDGLDDQDQDGDQDGDGDDDPDTEVEGD